MVQKRSWLPGKGGQPVQTSAVPNPVVAQTPLGHHPPFRQRSDGCRTDYDDWFRSVDHRGFQRTLRNRGPNRFRRGFEWQQDKRAEDDALASLNIASPINWHSRNDYTQGHWSRRGPWYTHDPLDIVRPADPARG